MAALQSELATAAAIQEKCRAQTSVVLDRCIGDVLRSCESIAAGGDVTEVVRTLKASLASAKPESSLAQATKSLHKVVGSLGKTIEERFSADISSARCGTECDPNLLNEVILGHLYQEGQFDVAALLVEEAGIVQEQDLREPFVDMHRVLQQIHEHNVQAVLDWADQNKARLEKEGQFAASFVFQVHRVAFIKTLKENGRQAALEYGRKHLTAFQSTHMPKIQQLMGALCFAGSAHVHNPYEETMSDSLWDALARDFVIQACSLLGQAQNSPLLVSVAAGATALPTMLKLAMVAPLQQALDVDADGEKQLPVDIPLGREFIFNSIFACPVSREQSTPDNPPVLLPCGHCMCRDSILKIAKSPTRSFKCPYCPVESTPLMCKEIIFPPVP